MQKGNYFTYGAAASPRVRLGKGIAAILLFLCALTASARDVAKLYKEYCANCHGANLQGQTTDSLLEGAWKHGGDDASLARIIREGYTNNGMPAMQGALSEPEIRAMVIFIREKRAEFATRHTSFARPLPNEVVSSQKHAFRLELVAEGLTTPWSMTFLPDGRMLVTELPGRLRLVDKDGQVGSPVSGTPRVRAVGQGGLMDVALHPKYAENGWIYLSYSDPGSNSAGPSVAMTAVVRGKIRDGEWVDQQTIFRAPPETYRTGGIHFGSRLVFDREGYLFFCIGERGTGEHAQTVTRPNGKVHRVLEDGRIPPDNPFVQVPGSIPSIWSYGHRNPQGLAFHPITGELWEVEHGPRGGDELNLVLKGHNYGWPVITYGMNYDGSPITDHTQQEGMEQPVTHWTPSIAVCALDFYTGDKFPRWKNNLLVTALAQEELRRLVLDGRQVLSQEVLFKNIGRVRDVVSAPDGLIYVALNKPDRIVRLVPVQ